MLNLGAARAENTWSRTSVRDGSVLVNEQEGTLMTRTTTLRAAFAVAVLALTGAACGSDDEGGDATETAQDAAAEGDTEATEAPAATEAPEATEAPAEGGGGDLVQAIADDIMVDVDAGDGPVANREEAECWANGVVDGIGEDRLNELGLTADNVVDPDQLDLTAEEVDVVVDSLFDCADVQQAFADQFAAQFGEEGANCVAEALDEELVREALSASIAGDDSEPSAEFLEKFTQIATDCGITG